MNKNAATLSGQFDIAQSQARCRWVRRRILSMSRNVAALHMGGAFSCAEILDCVYFGLMRKSSEGKFQDSFILSKGHAGITLYATLEEMKILSPEDLDAYCTPQGRLGAHPDRGLPGIEASTGSLGHGLGMGCGMALHDKVFKQDRIVYVVMSDGELQEGSVWEMLLQAPALGLTSLVVFVDYNNLQSLDFTSKTHPNFYPIQGKIEAFGWEVMEVDGHDQKAVLNAVASRTRRAPFLLICKTIKGKGVSFMENQPMWHYRSPNPEEFQQAMHELGSQD